MRRKLLWIPAVALAAVGIWLATRPQPIRVEVVEVAPGVVEATVANTRAGTVEACRRARLSPLSGGQVERLPVKEGDRVRPGQVLLSLWNDDVSAQVELAQANAATARTQSGQVCLMAEEAQREGARQAALHSQQITTEGDYDRAATNAQARQADCAASRETAGAAEAQLRIAQAALERTILTAPFAGVVAEINVERFEYVTPSPVGVATLPAIDLIDDSCMYVAAPIDEVDAPRVRSGLPARITVDALSGQSFAAKVRRVAPYVLDIEKQSRTVEVEAVFDAPSRIENLKTGQSADIEVILETREGVLRLPTGAVLEGNRVLLYMDGDLVERTFTPGLVNWQWTQVEAGLSTGDQVVTSLEREGVKAGARVVPEAAGK